MIKRVSEGQESSSERPDDYNFLHCKRELVNLGLLIRRLEHMRLSIVIPAYNEEQYLGKCLESVFRELVGNNCDAEVIVVNNASTDGTRSVATSFERVLVVEEPRKGLVQARHAGFLASKGDLIANVDADTILPRGWIERVLEEFARDKKLVALSGPFIFYDLSKFVNFWVKYFFFLGKLLVS